MPPHCIPNECINMIISYSEQSLVYSNARTDEHRKLMFGKSSLDFKYQDITKFMKIFFIHNALNWLHFPILSLVIYDSTEITFIALYFEYVFKVIIACHNSSVSFISTWTGNVQSNSIQYRLLRLDCRLIFAAHFKPEANKVYVCQSVVNIDCRSW